MAHPSEEEITRSLSSLRACAETWTEASMKLANAHQQWSGYLSDGLAFGVFIPAGLSTRRPATPSLPRPVKVFHA